eukprot:TRINITY_DN56728_c0_g1_i1.p1 TRINITY_DN56728_c0_g1~~TRINITY_DN56728_c0_g1_i1.p1  ORF type:complete len:633 (+),score=105.30 TRINITY_DN56728_c0_g1_i1:96-1994(+)
MVDWRRWLIVAYAICRLLSTLPAAAALADGAAAGTAAATSGDVGQLVGLWGITYDARGFHVVSADNTLVIGQPRSDAALRATRAPARIVVATGQPFDAEVVGIDGTETFVLQPLPLVGTGQPLPDLIGAILTLHKGALEVEGRSPDGSLLSARGRLVAQSSLRQRPTAEAALPAATCDFRGLPAECRGQSDVLKLLNLTCLACRSSACAPRASLVAAASDVLSAAEASTSGGARQQGAFASGRPCALAVMAALAVLVQLWSKKSLQDAGFTLEYYNSLQCPNGWTTMAPFPFSCDALDLYQRFSPVLVEPPCSGEESVQVPDADARSPLLGWFTHPKVWAEVTVPALLPREADVNTVQCPVAANDERLAARCRDRISQTFALSGGAFGRGGEASSPHRRAPLQWRCPGNGTANSRKYEDPARGCRTGHGTWGNRIEGRLKCVAVVVAETLGLRPGERVLDYGSGCGWTLTWFRQLYGIEGYGIDAAAANVEWTTVHSSGQYCLWSNSDLSWIPDGSFDAVTSYWVLYHLSREMQCRVARQLVQKLRVGGRAWFGGNCPSAAVGIAFVAMSEQNWKRCFLQGASSSQGVLELEFVTDNALFGGGSRGLHTPMEVAGSYVLWPPVFSLIVWKRA